jgi:hypothetical protein
MSEALLYQWATVDGRHGTPTVWALEAAGRQWSGDDSE